MRLALATTVATITAYVVESASSIQPLKDPEASMSSNEQQRDLQSFYTRYAHYPPYCSAPEEMKTRSIPPLQDLLPKNHNKNNNNNNNNNNNENGNKTKSLIGETRLVHVTAVIRHGARTPWSSEMKCWDGYWESPQTGVWDCDDLKTVMGMPKRGSSGSNNNNSSSSHPYQPILLFEKTYDALSDPNDNLGNVLNGTCQMGQLLQQGYEQQIQNGKILREAYAYKEGEYEHDQRMRLLNMNVNENHDINSLLQYPGLYFRADDYQRTVMSGQILLRSLFDPELAAYTKEHPYKSLSIPLHIADKDKDILDANQGDCPKLRAIKEEALNSDDYLEFYNSESSQEIRDYMRSNLGMGDESEILDCFMCTLCTDRPLPQSVDDYLGETSNTQDDWFTRLTEYEILKYTKVIKYDNAAHAKLSLGPLWYEIMEHINRVLLDKTAPKLSLFAGHDTTLMPLLASLGPDVWKDNEWATYASMMLIEIHELIDGRSDPEIYTSNFAFRLLYNGKILTPLIDGCHEDCELCDMKHLKAIVDPIATRDADCSVSSKDETPESSSSSSSSSEEANSGPELPSLVSTTGMALFVTLVLLSGFGGSAITFTVMRKRFNTVVNNRGVDFGGAWSIDNDEDDDYGLELTEGENHRS